MKVAVGVLIVLSALAAFGQQSAEEEVWKLEQAYWDYVKALDVDRYKTLWHPDFVGWPMSAAEPVRKDHITDWITAYQKKGQRLKSYKLERAASQATGNVVTTHYWLTELWADAQGRGEPDMVRIMHTWIRTPDGWQIVSGMSAGVKNTRGTDSKNIVPDTQLIAEWVVTVLRMCKRLRT